MITLTAPDGIVIADVTDTVDSLVHWMVTQPDKPKFKYSQDRAYGALTLQDEQDVARVKEFLYRQAEIHG